MRTLRSLLLILAALLPLTAGGCGLAADESAEPAPISLRMGIAENITSLNPVFAVYENERQIFFLVYETLFERGPQGEIRPYLAQTWEYTQDNTGLRITLNPSTWHDGSPLTADDVAFSLALYGGQHSSPLYETVSVIQSVQVLDERTLLILTDRPRADLTARLAKVFILPRHIWEPLGQGDPLRIFNNAEMIGSGPLRMVSWNRNRLIRLQTVPDHWRYHLAFDELLYREYENEEELVQALLDGKLDAAAGIHAASGNLLQDRQDILLLRGPAPRTRAWDIILNQIDPALCPQAGEETCRSHPALRDVNVRRALAYATPKETLIQEMLGGWGLPGLTIIAPVNAYHNNTLQDYPYDPALANRLLDEAGYLDSDGDGIREMPDGLTDLSFEISYPDFKSGYAHMAELLIPYWEALGLRLTVNPQPEDALGWYVNPSFRHDIVLWGWTSDLDPDFLLSVSTSGQIQTTWSESGYANPQYDALYDAQSLMVDTAQRIPLVWQMQEILLQDAVYITLFYEMDAFAATTDTFTGWGMQENTVNLFSIHTLCALRPVE